MTAPRWALALLRRAAPPGRAEDLLGDLEEAHRERVRRRGRTVARLLTGLEALDVAAALVGGRLRRRRAPGRTPAPGAETLAGGGAGAVSWLDVKLAFRMLIKYPGLTLVGGFAITVAMALGAAFFDTAALVHATLPLEGGERIVAIEVWDAEAHHQERRILHDFLGWREELGSVEELGAFRDVGRNLITGGGPGEPVRVAEITASGFRLARVPPLLGRHLLAEDERAGAPPVAVIGYHLWRSRFAADPAVLGRHFRLGSTEYAVVGVMPEGFAFPLNHRCWVPLRADPSGYERRQGPSLQVFGRLASGVSLAEAAHELHTIGLRAAADFPATHGRLRPRILPYTAQLFDDLEGWEIPLAHLLAALLLVVVCVNVAILVYARTVTRRAEIAVRAALGASRRRIVGQLFVEALLLSTIAAAAGLVFAGLTLRAADALIERIASVPFWIDFALSPGTVVYVLALTVLGAAIVGVVPAVKATGRGVQAGLRQVATSASGPQLGRTWTVLIVAQVAVAVAVLPAAVFSARQWFLFGVAEPGFAAQEFLTARLVIDREIPPSAEADVYQREFSARYADVQVELERRLDAEPGVSGVTFARTLPGEEPTVWVEIDGLPTPAETTSEHALRRGSPGHEVRFSRVDVDFFETFEVAVLAGRPFASRDLDAAADSVLVSRAFARRFLGDAQALGRRLRYVGFGGDAGPDDVEPGRWYEIVGVVSDFPRAMEPDSTDARLYHPVAPGEIYPVSLVLRLRGAAPATFSGRLREIAAALDPTLQLRRVLPLDEALGQEQAAMRMAAWTIALVTLSVLLLSAAGIYALMSFTVARRRREIGIRAALGAHPRHVLVGIFTRAAAQLGVGVAVGVAAAALLDRLSGGELLGGEGAVLLPAVAALMVAVGLLAAVGPARRGLRVEPTEALREG